jgi:hypothetical protein
MAFAIWMTVKGFSVGRIVAADTGSLWDITVQKLHVHSGDGQMCTILTETKNRSSNMEETMNTVLPPQERLMMHLSSLL